MFYVNIWKGQLSLRCWKCSSGLNMTWPWYLMIYGKRDTEKFYVWVSRVDIWDLLVKAYRCDSYSELAVFSLRYQCPTHPLKIISLLQKRTKFHLPLSAGVLTSLISLAMGVLSCWHMKYISHTIILQSRDNYSHSLLREAFADQTDLVMKRIYCFSYLLIIRISWLGKQPRWSLHRGWIPPEFALLNHQVLLED